MASCESTGGEFSFEWSHYRISSIDSKVRVTLQNPIKHSGRERVNIETSLPLPHLKRKASCGRGWIASQSSPPPPPPPVQGFRAQRCLHDAKKRTPNNSHDLRTLTLVFSFQGYISGIA